MSMMQRVFLTNGTNVDVPLKNSYDKLSISNDQGVLVWRKDGTIIPHDKVLAIVEMEVETATPTIQA